MSNFVTVFDKNYKSSGYYVSSGTKGIEDVYEKRLNDYREEEFVKTGTRNLYEEIQSFSEETDINFIVARSLKDGTFDLLSDDGKASVDVHNLPDNFSDLYNLKLRLASEFYKLSAEDRALFNNNELMYIDQRFSGHAEDIIKRARNVESDQIASDQKGE